MAKKSNTSFRLKRTSKSLLAPVEPIDRVSVQAETFRGISRLGSTLAESVKEFAKLDSDKKKRRAKSVIAQTMDAFEKLPSNERSKKTDFQNFMLSDPNKKEIKDLYKKNFEEELTDDQIKKYYQMYVEDTGGYIPGKAFMDDAMRDVKEQLEGDISFNTTGRGIPGLNVKEESVRKALKSAGIFDAVTDLGELRELEQKVVAEAFADKIPFINLKSEKNWNLLTKSLNEYGFSGKITKDQANQLRDVAAKALAQQLSDTQRFRDERGRKSLAKQLGMNGQDIPASIWKEIQQLKLGQKFGTAFNDAATGKVDIKSSVRRLEEQINDQQSLTLEAKKSLVNSLRRKEIEFYRRLVPQEKLVTTTTTTHKSPLDAAKQSLKGGGTSTKIQTAPARLSESSERFLSRYYHKVAKEAAKDGVTRPQDFEAVVRDKLNIAPDNANNFLNMLHAPGSERFHGDIIDLLDMRWEGRVKDEEFTDKISKLVRGMKDIEGYKGAAATLDFFGYEADENKIGMAIRKDAPEPESTSTPTTRPTQPTQSSGKKEGGGVWDKVQTWWYNL